ncbi:MAG: hypothetical protein JNL82_02875 [Myxococcales bacterium]|nr:hypothetical protein [Myxococcales bacterium]
MTTRHLPRHLSCSPLMLLLMLVGCFSPDSLGGPPGSTGASSGEQLGPPPTPEVTTSNTTTGTTAPPDDTSAYSSTSGTNTGTDTGADTGAPEPLCGNGLIDVGETCDLGWQLNSDAGECTMLCQDAVCGDGLVWADHEQCDRGPDNNDALYDACKTDCTWGPRCGDGLVHDGEEECDLAELNNSGESPPGGVPCTACRFAARLVFLGSQPYTAAELDGLPGADEHCQDMAADALFDNAPSFMAWLSDGVTSPAERFNLEDDVAKLPYVLPDGRRIADNWDDLISNGPDHGITLTEQGDELLDATVWTNTSALGEIFNPAQTCENWTNSLFNLQALVGRSGLAENHPESGPWKSERQWTRYEPRTCGTPRFTYCFEQ